MNERDKILSVKLLAHDVLDKRDLAITLRAEPDGIAATNYCNSRFYVTAGTLSPELRNTTLDVTRSVFVFFGMQNTQNNYD